MKYASIVLVAICAACLTQCSKIISPDNAAPAEFVAIGEAYGFCTGDCVSIWAIKKGKLVQDDMLRFTSPLLLKSTSLPGEKMKIVTGLISKMPAYLLKHTDTTFGCPDCHDQGMLYMEYHTSKAINRWKFDPVVERQPAELQPFVREMKEVIARLKQ